MAGNIHLSISLCGKIRRKYSAFLKTEHKELIDLTTSKYYFITEMNRTFKEKCIFFLKMAEQIFPQFYQCVPSSFWILAASLGWPPQLPQQHRI